MVPALGFLRIAPASSPPPGHQTPHPRRPQSLRKFSKRGAESCRAPLSQASLSQAPAPANQSHSPEVFAQITHRKNSPRNPHCRLADIPQTMSPKVLISNSHY